MAGFKRGQGEAIGAFSNPKAAITMSFKVINLCLQADQLEPPLEAANVVFLT